MRAKHRRKSINKRLMVIVSTTIGLVAMLAIVFSVLYFSGVFYQRLPIHQPVSVISVDTKDALAAATFDAGTILNVTEKLLSLRQDTLPFVVSWHLLPGSVSTMTEASSEYIITYDQILLLRAYIALDQKEKAGALADAIEEKLAADNGFLQSSVLAADISSVGYLTNPELETDIIVSRASYKDTMLYVRALLEQYTKWGTEKDFERIERYVELLYSSEILAPAELEIPAPTPTPVPKRFQIDNPSIVEADTTEVSMYKYLPLSSLSLSTLQMLSEIDSRYTTKYEEAKAIVLDGVISQTLPLFATAYDPEDAGYLYVSDGQTSLDLVDNLVTCNNLAEIDSLSPMTTSWLKEHILNQRVLYEKYDVLTGESTSENEAYASYALLLSIAVRTDDASLTQAAIEAMENHLATNAKSDAKGAFFRTVLSNRVSIYARENLLAVLSLMIQTENAA